MGGGGGEAKVLTFEELKVVRCDQQRVGTSDCVLTGERATSSEHNKRFGLWPVRDQRC